MIFTPLSAEKIREIWIEHGCDGEDAEGFARALEAAHQIGSMTTQSPTLASQATAELPKLPPSCAHVWTWRAEHPGKYDAFLDNANEPYFTADQMNAHYLAGVEAGRASRAQSEWQTPPASWRLLAKAAIELLCAIDTKHDTEKPPTKYAVPYGAVNQLRAALGCAEDQPATLGETK